MKNKIARTLFSLLIIIVIGHSSAEDRWTAGAVAIATAEDSWSVAALPWLSYQGDWFTINPMKAAVIGQGFGVQWEAGIGLDYNELFDHTERSVLAQIDTQAFLGPARFTLSTANRLIEPVKAWKASGAVGSQFPIGSGLLGAELGLHSESAQWNDDKDRTNTALSPTAALQYGLPVGKWQAMLIAKVQGASFTTDDRAIQTYTVLLMRSW